MAVKGIPL